MAPRGQGWILGAKTLPKKRASVLDVTKKMFTIFVLGVHALCHVWLRKSDMAHGTWDVHMDGKEGE